jgi:hypothetical protein
VERAFEEKDNSNSAHETSSIIHAGKLQAPLISDRLMCERVREWRATATLAMHARLISPQLDKKERCSRDACVWRGAKKAREIVGRKEHAVVDVVCEQPHFTIECR